MSGLPGDAWETETETMESRGATMAYLLIIADEKLEVQGIFIGFQEDLIWETRWNQWFSAIEGDELSLSDCSWDWLGFDNQHR